MPWGNYRMMIREVIIEDGVTTIGSNAFSDCLNLRFITLPISCVSINSYAFSGVDSLDAVFYKGNSSDWDNVSVASEGNAALTNALVKHNIKVTGIIGGTSGLAYYVDISNIFALIGDPPVDTSVYVATYLSNGKMTGIHIITVGNNPITIDEDADIGRIYLLDTGVSPVCVNEVLAY